MEIIGKNSVERMMLIGFAITLAVLIVIGSIAWSGAASFASFRSVGHTREVMAEFVGLQATTDEAENGQWAYFLTKESRFLVQRDSALSGLATTFQKLLALSADNALQGERIHQLENGVSQWRALLMASQATFDRQGFNAARAEFEAGQEASAKVKDIVQEAADNELALLDERKKSEEFRLKVIVAGILLLLIFLGVLAVQMRRAIRSQLAVERANQEARQILLKASALQDAIFNSANFSSIATDAQGVIQIFNVGAERMLGYSAAEVVDKITPAGISDPQEVIARAATLSQELNTSITPGFEALVFKASRGIEDIYELTYIRKDGSRFPAIISVTALRDAQEKVIGYLLIGIDNTARKEVEAEQARLDQRLRDQQFYTRSLIEANIDAIMTTDPRGIISDVNQQMEALTGCTRDELIGAPFKNYFTDPERAEAAIKQVLREGKVTNYELTAHARDGTETVVSYNATTFHDRDRNLRGVFAAARNITERKLIEHALQENNLELESAKAIAEKANRAKSDFLSSMSHELRTPLNAILGFAQLLDSGKPSPSSEQKLSIDQILQAGWYLLRLINEILDLSMIESGKVTLSLESMSLSEVLQDCQAMIEPQADKRSIQMSFPSLEHPFYIHADRTRVKQVIINLLSNAIKYNQIGGAVIVQCALGAEGKVRISVKDTGAGLAPEQLAQLFQPFNRLGQEAGAEEGTGIGLVVTKQLVELMGGVIGVDSNVGVGSVFWFELNAANEPDVDIGSLARIGTDERDQAADAPEARHTLLYVEDNPANLLLVEQLIARRSDLKLVTAIDGHLGILLARTCRPDIILMDINLPGISGFGALKILQDDPLTAHIPVVALSANAMPRDIDKGLRAGFLRYLTKPIRVEEFMDALDVALHYAADNGLIEPSKGIK